MDSSVAVLQTQRDTGIDIAFCDLSYAVQVPDQKQTGTLSCKKVFVEKPILKSVSGIFPCGQISAIMGASGAGKTTLLNLLACRMNQTGTGKLYANHEEYSHEKFGDFANYVMQSDVLMQTLTVRETLEFAANLKLNESTEVKKQRMEELSNRLKLEKCLDVVVGGNLIKGISGGQKKRTSIAFELISDPKVVMLDEPTSGLDSLTSYIIVDYLAKLAHQSNKTVFMTIHQPNSEIFNIFDRLLLLVQGRIIYQGSAKDAVTYFGSNFGLLCPEFHNPADYFMGIMHHQSKENVVRFPEYFQKYEAKIAPLVARQIEARKTTTVERRRVEVDLTTSYGALIKRDFLNTIRNPLLIKARLLQTIFLAIYIGGLFFNVTNDGDHTTEIRWRAFSGFAFFLSINGMMFSLSPVSIVFPLQREIFLKQEGARLYSVLPYYISRNIIEIPYLVFFPLLSSLIVYWFVRLSNTPEQFFTFFLISFLIGFAGNSLGLLLGSVIIDAKAVSSAISLFITPFIAFSGFYKNRGNLPVWIGWIQYISPLKYSFIGYMKNQVQYDPLSRIAQLNFDLDLWQAIFTLLGLSLCFRLLSLFFLWYLKTRLQ